MYSTNKRVHSIDFDLLPLNPWIYCGDQFKKLPGWVWWQASDTCEDYLLWCAQCAHKWQVIQVRPCVSSHEYSHKYLIWLQNVKSPTWLPGLSIFSWPRCWCWGRWRPRSRGRSCSPPWPSPSSPPPPMARWRTPTLAEPTSPGQMAPDTAWVQIEMWSAHNG